MRSGWPATFCAGNGGKAATAVTGCIRCGSGLKEKTGGRFVFIRRAAFWPQRTLPICIFPNWRQPAARAATLRRKKSATRRKRRSFSTIIRTIKNGCWRCWRRESSVPITAAAFSTRRNLPSPICRLPFVTPRWRSLPTAILPRMSCGSLPVIRKIRCTASCLMPAMRRFCSG